MVAEAVVGDGGEQLKLDGARAVGVVVAVAGTGGVCC